MTTLRERMIFGFIISASGAIISIMLTEWPAAILFAYVTGMYAGRFK